MSFFGSDCVRQSPDCQDSVTNQDGKCAGVARQAARAALSAQLLP
jgi:hypothetical protein